MNNKPKIKTLYGWTFLNERNYGKIESIRVSEDDFMETSFCESGEVSFLIPIDGSWFTTFSAAKRQMITELKAGIIWRQDILSKVRKFKKPK